MRLILGLTASVLVLLALATHAVHRAGRLGPPRHRRDGELRGAERPRRRAGQRPHFGAIPDSVYAGGVFTSAGGNTSAVDRSPAGTASAWHSIGAPPISTAAGAGVDAIAVDRATGKVYVGGNFTNAGGNPNADFLAVWDGASWKSFCAPITANVKALQIIGRTLYIGGDFADGAGLRVRRQARRLRPGHRHALLDGRRRAPRDQQRGLRADRRLGRAALCRRELHQHGPDPQRRPRRDVRRDVARDEAGRGRQHHPQHRVGRDQRLHRQRRRGHRGHRPGRPRRQVERLGVERARRERRERPTAGSRRRRSSTRSPRRAPTSSSTGSFQNADGHPTADKVAGFNGFSWAPMGSNGAGNGPLRGPATRSPSSAARSSSAATSSPPAATPRRATSPAIRGPRTR